MNEDVEKIQNKSFEILKVLVELFEKYDLKYYLAGGTFLGAVRHRGFIPWDDDIDISMPREDYEKFLGALKNNLPDYFFVQNFKTDPSYRYFITRVLDTRYDVKEIRTSTITHPAVDILPLDGAPNNSIKRYFYYKKMMAIRYLISIANSDVIDMERSRGFFEKMVVTFVKAVPFEKFLNDKKLKNYMEQSMMKYSMDHSYYCGCLMGAYRTREMVPTNLYGVGKTYIFEDRGFNGPIYFDEYLSLLYGDYMKIPNQNDISSKRHYQISEKKKVQ